MAKSFIRIYLGNPNTRLYDIQNFLDYQKEIQDRISYKTQEWKDCEWLCVYEHNGLMVNPFCMTLYRTDKIEISGDYHERDYSKISIDFKYIACAKLELGKSWTATVGHTSPVPCSIKLSDLGDVLSDETVQELRALVFTKPRKDYNCETITNQRNHSMCEEVKEQTQEPFTYDPKDSTGEYYVHTHPFETINYMEYLAEEWTKNKLPPKVICALLQVAKYLSPRLGRKGGKEELEKDLFKIENYAHRARTGGWINLEDSKENK